MRNRFIFFIFAVCVLLLFTACNQTVMTPSDAESVPAVKGYQKITAVEGKELLDNDETVKLVDVRRADEYAAAHIPGAINVPNESIIDTPPDALPDFDQTIIVYCRTGERSKQAADKLAEMGYTDVRDMGGIVSWPYDTVSGTEPGE